MPTLHILGKVSFSGLYVPNNSVPYRPVLRPLPKYAPITIRSRLSPNSFLYSRFNFNQLLPLAPARYPALGVFSINPSQPELIEFSRKSSISFSFLTSNVGTSFEKLSSLTTFSKISLLLVYSKFKQLLSSKYRTSKKLTVIGYCKTAFSSLCFLRLCISS